MTTSRKKVNKHLEKYDTLNTLAYRAIKEGLIINNFGIRIEYKETENKLYISDFTGASVYIPKITKDEVEPFAKLLYKTINESEV